jgi:hypothetical protein
MIDEAVASALRFFDHAPVDALSGEVLLREASAAGPVPAA